MYALRIVSRDKILRFKNTFIIIINSFKLLFFLTVPVPAVCEDTEVLWLHTVPPLHHRLPQPQHQGGGGGRGQRVKLQGASCSECWFLCVCV